MFFKNKLERLLERICVIVLCVITAVMAIPVKSMTAAGSASVVLEILYEGDTVNVKFKMVSNPGIAGMSFKLCYDSSLLSIVSCTVSYIFYFLLFNGFAILILKMSIQT